MLPFDKKRPNFRVCLLLMFFSQIIQNPCHPRSYNADQYVKSCPYNIAFILTRFVVSTWPMDSSRSIWRIPLTSSILFCLFITRSRRPALASRPLALEFGLLRMVRQPSADAHVIWVARHKVRPWKDHFKSDLRSDQDHLLKKDLRSDQDHIF
jgi:hypothetical protein